MLLFGYFLAIYGQIADERPAPLLIRSVSYSAIGLPAATQIYVADGAAMQVVPGGLSFVLSEAARDPIQLPNEGEVVIPLVRRDGPDGSRWADAIDFAPAPLRRIPGAGIPPWRGLGANRISASPALEDGSVRVLTGRQSGYAGWNALEGYVRRADGNRPARYAPLPSLPNDLVVFGSAWERNGDLLLATLDGTTARIVRIADNARNDVFAWETPLRETDVLASEMLAQNGVAWFALSSSDRAATHAAPVTRLWVGDASTQTSANLDTVLPGKLTSSGIVPRGEREALIVTAHAYPPARWIHHVRFENGACELLGTHTFARTGAPLPVHDRASGETLAADGNRLYRLGDGGWEELRGFDAPLTAMARAWGRWYVGVGHRVIRLGKAFENDVEFAIPAGRVEAIFEADPAFWAEDDPDLDGADGRYELPDSPQGRNPDVDGDGIPDGLDAWPLRPAARITDLNRDRLTVRDARGGESLLLLGENVRIESVTTANGGPPPDWIEFDETIVSNTSAVRFRAVPGYDAAAVRLVLHARDIYSNRAISWGDWPVDVRLDASPPKPRRLLWFDRAVENAPQPWSALHDLLAAPPHFFSHRTVTDPVDRVPPETPVVVANITAAARGQILRGALSDYVRQGGALLLWIDDVPEGSSLDLTNFWLETFGAALGRTAVDESALASDHPLAAKWPSKPAAPGPAGYRFILDDLATPIIADEHGCILAERIIGVGRVVFLADVRALADNGAGGLRHPRFADGLFAHLAATRRDLRDLDGDGLADRLEDRNNSGSWEPGETDFLHPDTDGDGIPDGLEDTNGNGLWDPWETHPLIADTDGDGIPDGADPAPLPRVGATVLSAVTPAYGPAEGGLPVEIVGRNLPPDAEVLFGPYAARRLRPGSDARLTVEVPALPVEGLALPVDVTVRSRGGADSATLPGGFSFTERSVVSLGWSELARIAQVYDGYAGRVSLNLAAESAVPDSLDIWITIEPGGALHASEWTPSAALLRSGGTIEFRRVYEQAWHLRVTGVDAGMAGAPLALFSYRAIPEQLAGKRFRVQITRVQALTRAGGAFEVPIAGMDIPLPPAPP